MTPLSTGPPTGANDQSIKGKNSSRLADEKFERLIAEVEDYAILLLDTNGIVISWNKGAERIKGYSAEEIIGKSFKIFYPREDTEVGVPDMLLEQAVKKGKASHEGWRIKKNGTRFWGSVVITATHDDQGKIIGFLKVTRDLTERKLTEDQFSSYVEQLRSKNEELKHSEDRYHKMISEIQDYAILLLNTSGDIQNWNAGAEVIKGYKAEEIIGKNFSVFYTTEDLELGLPGKLLREAELKGKAISEGWRKRKDGTKFWGSVVITALHDSEGKVMGFSKVTRDLTEKKKSEDNLKESALELEMKNHVLERLNAELSSFAYVISHDLKEPIRKIQIFASRQLEENKSQEQIKEYSEKIVSSALRMQRLMEALLSYSQISNNPNKSEEVDLNEILEAVKADLEIIIVEKNVRIESARLPVILGISFQLHQLFLNLISNSIKFSREKKQPVITISSRAVPSPELPEELFIKNKVYHLITIKDNGVGFEQEYSDKIFDVFQRLNPKSDLKGTGIGLAIVKRVVQNHDGLIVAEGKVNEGATFKIYLPG